MSEREKKKQIFQQIWFNLKFSVLYIQQSTLYLRIEWNEMAKIKLNRKKNTFITISFNFLYEKDSIFHAILFNNKTKTKTKKRWWNKLLKSNIYSICVPCISICGFMFDLKNSISKNTWIKAINMEFRIESREKKIMLCPGKLTNICVKVCLDWIQKNRIVNDRLVGHYIHSFEYIPVKMII